MAITCAAALIHDTVYACVCVALLSPVLRVSVPWTEARGLKGADPYEWGLHSRDHFSRRDHAARLAFWFYSRISRANNGLGFTKGRHVNAIGRLACAIYRGSRRGSLSIAFNPFAREAILKVINETNKVIYLIFIYFIFIFYIYTFNIFTIFPQY